MSVSLFSICLCMSVCTYTVCVFVCKSVLVSAYERLYLCFCVPVSVPTFQQSLLILITSSLSNHKSFVKYTPRI